MDLLLCEIRNYAPDPEISKREGDDQVAGGELELRGQGDALQLQKIVHIAPSTGVGLKADHGVRAELGGVEGPPLQEVIPATGDKDVGYRADRSGNEARTVGRGRGDDAEINFSGFEELGRHRGRRVCDLYLYFGEPAVKRLEMGEQVIAQRHIACADADFPLLEV